MNTPDRSVDEARANEAFWSTYYADVVARGPAWLDYSNERVQLQTFALALEASGPVRHRRCLDVGCGRGDFTRTLDALGAADVTGVEIVSELVAQNLEARPDIRWLNGTVRDLDRAGELQSYDLIFLIEVLQYLPCSETLSLLWTRLQPGGRLIAVVPNADCPIVSRTRARFGEKYEPPPVAELLRLLAALPDLQSVACRGLFFDTDQRIAPYRPSRWMPAAAWPTPPNRVQVVAIKHDPLVDEPGAPR